jgi:2-polyprenyl-6-methoxyphenol hydroxylase-like FAD-dependent oxidoreductase
MPTSSCSVRASRDCAAILLARPGAGVKLLERAADRPDPGKWIVLGRRGLDVLAALDLPVEATVLAADPTGRVELA